MLTINAINDPRTVVVISPKGGSGTTTLALNVAGYLASTGKSVGLLDLDAQGSSLYCLGARSGTLSRIQALRPTTLPTPWGRWQRAIVPRDVGYVVVDAPSRLARAELRQLTRAASAILVPVLPACLDIKVVTRFVAELIERGDPHLPTRVAVVANRVSDYCAAYLQLTEALAEVQVPLLATLRETRNYGRAASSGRSIHEMPAVLARHDREQWADIVQWLERRLCVARPRARTLERRIRAGRVVLLRHGRGLRRTGSRGLRRARGVGANVAANAAQRALAVARIVARSARRTVIAVREWASVIACRGASNTLRAGLCARHQLARTVAGLRGRTAHGADRVARIAAGSMVALGFLAARCTLVADCAAALAAHGARLVTRRLDALLRRARFATAALGRGHLRAQRCAAEGLAAAASSVLGCAHELVTAAHRRSRELRGLRRRIRQALGQRIARIGARIDAAVARLATLCGERISRATASIRDLPRPRRGLLAPGLAGALLIGVAIWVGTRAPEMLREVSTSPAPAAAVDSSGLAEPAGAPAAGLPPGSSTANATAARPVDSRGTAAAAPSGAIDRLRPVVVSVPRLALPEVDPVERFRQRWQLSGVASAAGSSVVLLSDREERTTQALRASEDLEGWTVTDAGPNFAVFSQQGREVRLVLNGPAED